jgi:hypothetical protein
VFVSVCVCVHTKTQTRFVLQPLPYTFVTFLYAQLISKHVYCLLLKVSEAAVFFLNCGGCEMGGYAMLKV